MEDIRRLPQVFHDVHPIHAGLGIREELGLQFGQVMIPVREEEGLVPAITSLASALNTSKAAFFVPR
ncbi:hypothetical protein D3C86_1899040 [compost metagenome]